MANSDLGGTLSHRGVWLNTADRSRGDSKAARRAPANSAFFGRSWPAGVTVDASQEFAKFCAKMVTAQIAQGKQEAIGMAVQLTVYDDLDPVALRRRGTAKWNFYDADVLALWVAEMDYPTAPVVLDAIQDAVDRQEFGYPSLSSSTALSLATAEWAKSRYSWAVDPQRVHVLPDVLKGVELGVSCYSPDGSPIILTTPAYMPFFEVPKVIGRPIIEVPMLRDPGRAELDLDGIDAAFAAGAGTLILCNPYNPLGRSFSTAELTALAEVVERHGARVVSDEIHGPLTYGRAHVPYASVSDVAARHSITLVSASKAWNLPGLKCAQVITSSDEDEERWQKISRLSTHGAATLGIDSNLAAYRYGASWLDQTLAYLDGNRRLLAELLADKLPDVGYVMPEATYLSWLDFGELGLGVEPAEFFLEHARVAMNPGIAFGANGTGCARLNFATSASILERAVTALADAVHTAPRG